MWPFRSKRVAQPPSAVEYAELAPEQAEQRPTPPGGEVAGIGDDDKFGAIYGTQPELQNPDVVLADLPERKDETIYDHYERMLKLDGHLAGLFAIRASDLVTCGWHIEPGGELLRDRKLAEWVEAKLRAIKGFDQDLKALLDAVAKGFVATEVMWARDGDEVVISELRARRQRRFTFHRDSQLLLKKHLWDTAGLPVPECKFLVHRNGAPYESPFGEALLGKCVWPEWLKRKNVRFWALFNEKRAFPPAVGKYDRARPEDKEVLLRVIRTLQAESGVAMPKDVELEFVQQNSHVPIRTYSEFIAAMDAWEAKIVLGQTLTTGEGAHGTQALGRVHRRTSDDLVALDGQLLGETLDTLIEWLVGFNYAQLPASMPRFVFDTDPGDDLKAMADRDKVLAAEIGVPVAKSYWYDTYGLPEPTEDDPALDLAPKPASPPPAPEEPMMASGRVALNFRELKGEDDADALFNELDAKTEQLLKLIASDVAEGLRKNSGGRPASTE